jgi:hypothetical protein
MSNAHRASKRAFQANLKQDEALVVDKVKKLLGVTTDRQLIVKLCQERVS